MKDLTAQARPDAEPAKPQREVDAVTAAIRARMRLTQSQMEVLLAVHSSHLIRQRKSAIEFSGSDPDAR